MSGLNRSEIIYMARQAGSLIEIAQEKDLLWLEAFAALVASAEREACAKLCEGLTGRSYEFDMGRLHSAEAIRERK